MYLSKTLIVLAAAAIAVAATPGMKRAEAVPQDNCHNYIGDCYENGCGPSFPYGDATIGWCTQGDYYGCPCEKCGGPSGKYVGPCVDNGCFGYQGKCTAGNYQGCPCH